MKFLGLMLVILSKGQRNPILETERAVKILYLLTLVLSATGKFRSTLRLLKLGYFISSFLSAIIIGIGVLATSFLSTKPRIETGDNDL
jgi:hypothetical protein